MTRITRGRNRMAWATVHCDIIGLTNDALLIQPEEIGQLWVPRSVIEEPKQYDKKDTNVDINIREWFCQSTGMI